MTRSGFIEEKKTAEATIAFADGSDVVGLACLASVVGTYLLARVRPCDCCWPATINHLRSRSPSKTNPEPHVCGSVVVGEANGASHNPTGTSFKTRLFPALHVPSLESLGHMPRDVIAAEKL